MYPNEKNRSCDLGLYIAMKIDHLLIHNYEVSDCAMIAL